MAWLIYLLVLTAALAALLIAPMLLAPRRRTEAKEVRFEAGNPPYGRTRRRMAMQYINYVYLAVAAESIVGMSIAYYLMDAGVLLAALIAIAATTATAYVAAKGYGR